MSFLTWLTKGFHIFRSKKILIGSLMLSLLSSESYMQTQNKNNPKDKKSIKKTNKKKGKIQFLPPVVTCYDTIALAGYLDYDTLEHSKDKMFLESIYYYMHQQIPEFPGGKDSLNRYIVSKFIYPEFCIRGLNGISKMTVKLTILPTGEVTNPIITKGINSYFDEEILRIVKTLPHFKPGMVDGNPISVDADILIVF